MRWFPLAVLLVACTGPSEAIDPGPDASTPKVDAGPGIDAPPSVDAPPPVDAAPSVDAPFVACDTVQSATTLTTGGVITTCLNSDADIDTYRWTAPMDAAGGLLRFKLEFTECQLAFALWNEFDPMYAQTQSQNGTDYPNVAQVDHFMVATVYPGNGYELVVKKRRPFVGTCSYTLTTTYAPIADSYEPNQSSATANQLTVGQTMTAYMACVSQDRNVSIDDCTDRMKINLPTGHYALTWNLPSPPNLNPCLSVSCFTDSGNVQNHSEFDCVASGPAMFLSSFNVQEPSHCSIYLHGSSNGSMVTGWTASSLPGSPRGTTTPYTFKIVSTPP